MLTGAFKDLVEACRSLEVMWLMPTGVLAGKTS